MTDLPHINQGVKETKSVSRSAAGKTTVTVTLTADDGTVSRQSAYTYSESIASQYAYSRRMAYVCLAELLNKEERHDRVVRGA